MAKSNSDKNKKVIKTTIMVSVLVLVSVTTLRHSHGKALLCLRKESSNKDGIDTDEWTDKNKGFYPIPPTILNLGGFFPDSLKSVFQQS